MDDLDIAAGKKFGCYVIDNSNQKTWMEATASVGHEKGSFFDDRVFGQRGRTGSAQGSLLD